MDKLVTRRTNPISHVAALAVTTLLVCEVLIMVGGLELKAQTVAKYAPWAYEPFLKLVGEHPGSAPRWAAVEKADESVASPSTVSGMGGLTPGEMLLPIEINEPELSTNIVLEPSIPLEAELESVPVTTSTNNVPTPSEKIVVPVG